MNILILGSGGREHAFAWKLKQSPICNHLWVAPGNGGSKQVAQNIAIDPSDFSAIKSFVLKESIDMVVVGPEVPLVEGIYDFFMDDQSLNKVKVIGPSKHGAQLEGSKSFAKYFMQRHNIPTAAFNEFTQANLEEGLAFIDENKAPFVLKADGLAAGKGVVITESKTEAKQTLQEMISDAKFGDASSKVIIEEFLNGIEFSVFVLSDGSDYVLLPNAKDYKRIGEKDTGLNTGGMGAISPVPFVDEDLMRKVKSRVINPTIEGLKAEKIVYKGFIYVGLILVDEEPYVIEYNCRMGDPETEIVLPRLENDLADLLVKCSEGKLKNEVVEYRKEHGATVILASGGYPEAYEKGKQIVIPACENTTVFQAGTKEIDNVLVTNGGRVLAVSALGENLADALLKANQQADAIVFEGKYFRKDIGFEF